MGNFKSYSAEFIATFTLIFIGAGSVLVNGLTNGALGLVGIALAHGLAIMTMVYAFGHVSGAHINPAVTIAMWATKRMSTINSLAYVISQLLGAAVGALLLLLIFTPVNSHLGATEIAPGFGFWNAVALEAVLTFLLVTVIFGTAVDKRAPVGFYGLAIGLTITLDILIGGPFTGASMNPARSFGPALISNFWEMQLVHWIGPIIGGLIAAFVYDKIVKQ
ncbi:aquaporin [Candidatus Micrarchaeota archaeon]|nr:aquaporin [Candidatus Micrarchaeota archaeon]